MKQIIEIRLKRLEYLYYTFYNPHWIDLSSLEKYRIKLAVTQLQEAFGLVSETQDLLLNLEEEPPVDPVFMSLLDSARTELQECLHALELVLRNQINSRLTSPESYCAREAIFSGILALQLFIAP